MSAVAPSLRALIHERTGLEVPSPSPQFEMAVRDRKQRLGCASDEEYAKRLRALPIDADEWLQIIHAGTNRLTHFLRDHEQLEVGCRLLSQMAMLKLGRPLQVWSAGCSTGEEPYSIVMLADSLGVSAIVYGSDINQLALAVARRGIYASWSLRHVPHHIRDKYFSKTAEGAYEVKSWIRDRTVFRRHNLVQDPPLAPEHSGGWDLIICRNVIIYYSEHVVSTLLRRLAGSLSETGVLALGASETVTGRNVALRPKLAFGRVVYTPARSKSKLPSLISIVPRHDSVAAPRRERSEPPSVPVATFKTLPPESAELASYAQIREDVVHAMSSGDVAEARTLLCRVLGKHPQDVLANLALGHIYLLAHEFERALNAYETVVRLEPTLPEAHYFVGLTERKQRRFEHALAAFRRAVFLEPTFWCASYQLGAIALRLGKRNLQRQEWQRTLDLLHGGEGTLPLVSHPIFYNSLLVTPTEAIEMCESLTG